ncbi:MAG: hypothetical protein ACD_79C00760G0001 [uncultured bacterium]|nr:MAG: hypothetical protein ACD_79C00760G0001 [uncultured bacterium]
MKYELDSEEALGGEEEKKSTSKIIPVLLILCILVSGVTYYFVSAKQKKAMAKEKQELERLAEQVKQAAEESPAKLLELAGKAMQENAFNEALKIIETVLAKNPNNAEAMLLKNKVTLKLKVSGLDESFNKGMKYYQSNDFDNARKAFSKIDTEYAKYDEVQKIIATLGKTDSAEQLTNDAFSLFTKGDLEQAINKLENALNLVPVLIQAKELRQTVLSVKELMTVLETASSNQQEQVLNKIVAAVPDSSNYFNTFAKDKLKELKTGKNLKTEIFYASGIEALATRQYAIAYENFKKAYALSPEIIKIKLALTETTQKRQKLLQKLNAAATAIEKESPIKAKYIWKKIIEFGEDDNSFYKSALDKLQI